MTALDEDDSVRVVVLTGNGPAFCAGVDLKESVAGDGSTAARAEPVAAPLERFRKPLLAAINGPAVGGGFELALAADMRIASTAARFALPEVKLGSLPGSGGTQRLSRAVSPAVANKLVFTGEPIDAEAALACGLVSDLVSPEELLPLAESDRRAHRRQRPALPAGGEARAPRGPGRHSTPAVSRSSASSGRCSRPPRPRGGPRRVPRAPPAPLRGRVGGSAWPGAKRRSPASGRPPRGSFPVRRRSRSRCRLSRPRSTTRASTKDDLDGLLTMPGTTSPEGPKNYLTLGGHLGINPTLAGSIGDGRRDRRCADPAGGARDRRGHGERRRLRLRRHGANRRLEVRRARRARRLLGHLGHVRQRRQQRVHRAASHGALRDDQRAARLGRRHVPQARLAEPARP